MSAMLNIGSAPPKSSGAHLQELRESLAEKMDAYKIRIDEDELTKNTLLKELKAVSLKLEEVDRRLGKLNAAKNEYVKTQQEVLFALDKLGDASSEIGNRINSFGGAGQDKAEQFLKQAGL
jgi:DNA repair ATPase RecN